MRRIEKRRTVVLPVALCAFVTFLIGCESVPEFAAPRVVPDEVAFVRDNSEQFAQTENDPLADTPAGTVIDDSGRQGAVPGEGSKKIKKKPNRPHKQPNGVIMPTQFPLTGQGSKMRNC